MKTGEMKDSQGFNADATTDESPTFVTQTGNSYKTTGTDQSGNQNHSLSSDNAEAAQSTEDGGRSSESHQKTHTENAPNGQGNMGNPPAAGRGRGFANSPLWTAIMAILGVFIASSIFGGIIGAVIKSITNADQAFVTFLSNAIGLTITIVFAVVLLNIRHVPKPILTFSLKKANPSIILWGLVLVFVVSIVLEPLLMLFPELPMETLRIALGTGGWALMSVVVLAPVMEEILFRGIIQQQVTNEFGPVKGILVAAAIFGIVHIIPQQVINAFFVGIILGYIYYKTRSLVPVIIIHAVNNALAYLFMIIYEDRAFITMRQIIGSNTWYWILYILCAIVFVVALVNIWYQLNKKEKKPAKTGA